MKKTLFSILLFVISVQDGIPQKGKFSLASENGFSIPTLTYARNYRPLSAFTSNFHLGYYLSDKSKLGLHFGTINHRYDAQTTADNVFLNAEPSMFGEPLIGVKVSGYNKYQHLLLGLLYIYEIPLGENFRLDLKASLGVDLFQGGRVAITTYYDDAPFNRNMREELILKSGNCSSIYSFAGLGFRHLTTDRISFGLSLELGSTTLNYSQSFTQESLDDLYSYEKNSGKVNHTYNAGWFNIYGGVTYLLGKGK